VALGEDARHPPAVARLLTLHNRTKRWGALPLPGGLSEQPEKLLRLLELIDEAFAEEHELRKGMDDAAAAARKGGHHFVRRRR